MATANGEIEKEKQRRRKEMRETLKVKATFKKNKQEFSQCWAMLHPHTGGVTATVRNWGFKYGLIMFCPLDSPVKSTGAPFKSSSLNIYHQ